MGATISLMNQKGGVGKTTLAVHIGVGLAALGYKVAMIDMDPQGQLLVSLALDSMGDDDEGIFNLLVNGYALEETLRQVPEDRFKGYVEGRDTGTLTLLPGGQRTQLAALDMQLRGADFNILRQAFEPLQTENHFIIVDTPPTLSLFTPAILGASNYVIIPTELDRLGIDGVEKFMGTVINLSGMHSAQVMAILPTRTKPQTREHLDRAAELSTKFPGLVWTDYGITESTLWKEASDAGLPVFGYAPAHQAADQAWRVVGRVLEVVQKANQ